MPGRIAVLCLLVLLILTTVPVVAQGSACPSLVDTAMNLTDNSCTGIGRNQACYGHNIVSAEPQVEDFSLSFEAPGDTADVTDLRRISLGAMDEAFSEWGVVMMKLQANLPDTLPGQNVTLVMFGDVEITDTTVRDEEAEVQAPPLQSFSLRSGIGGTRCDATPENGIMIQTPEDTSSVRLDINGVRFLIGSTLFVQAQPGGVMTVSVVEGQVAVTADGTQVWIPAGARVEIPLDANGEASGPPGILEAYEDMEALAAPIRLMPVAFELPPPISDDALVTYQNSPLVSDQYGNACVPGGLSAFHQFAPDNLPRRTRSGTIGVFWHAKAGVTATFVAGGDARIRPDLSPPAGFVFLRPIESEDEDRPAFAASDSNTLTYTFEEDMTFYVWVAGGGPEGALVTLDVTCEG